MNDTFLNSSGVLFKEVSRYTFESKEGINNLLLPGPSGILLKEVLLYLDAFFLSKVPPFVP